MGLFDKIFGRRPKQADTLEAFRTLTAYQPAFTSFGGEIYESELVRAAIHALATHSSKLDVSISGGAKPKLQTQMRKAPNGWQTWSQFLYRLRTILEVQCTAFVVPVLDDYGSVVGIFPVLPSRCELKEWRGVPYLCYTFQTGETAAIELGLCGVLTKFQYQDDVLGTSNRALDGTMDLIDMQQQGIQEGIKNGATFRFMATLSNFSTDDDLAKEMKRFNQNTLRGESGGLLLFSNKYKDIKQIDQKPYVVDADQMKLIQDNVYTYFGLNQDVLQNRAYGDAWSAFYEGAIEPFAIQLSEVLTKMLFSPLEQGNGNRVFAASNRLQYMTNKDKLNVSSQLTDRGILNRDDARKIWNLPPIEDGSGQAYIIRGEYKNAADRVADESEVDQDDGNK